MPLPFFHLTAHDLTSHQSSHQDSGRRHSSVASRPHQSARQDSDRHNSFQKTNSLKKMDIEQKIWASAAVLFLTTGMAAFDHAAWLICTAAALLLGGLFVIRNFPPVLYIPPYVVLPLAHFCEGIVMIFTPLLLKLLSGLQVDKPLLSLFLFMSAASYFCVLMMFRPVVTDFSLLYSVTFAFLLLLRAMGSDSDGQLG
uniref:Uncharacterized protein n=1 Tax=Nicotiana tabacum TaxID=4097 RepID=A0A1S3XAD4_TOBAC|nr:PREDICTED: uncharacterized protein LOC107762984 [Nicotiana tabacum]